MINNVAKLLKESKQAEWTAVIAAACEAGNCAVSRSLSEGGEMVSPSELWYGRNTILDGFLRTTSTKKLAHAYARGLKEQLAAIKEIVTQSRERYQTRMRAGDKNKENTVRKLKAGQEVSLYRPTKSKKMDKLSELMRGPYKVVQVMPSGVDYRIRLKGSTNKKDDQIRHIDEIRLLRRFDSVEMSAQTHRPASKRVAKKTAKRYEVKHICGERTDAAEQTQYLIKWKGYGEHTWEAWLATVTMHAVHYCAFGGDFYKPTNIWTTLDWEPKGNTSNGKCACVKEHGKEKHEYVIGGPMGRKMPGPAYKQKVWAMPRLLREELMDAIKLKQPEKKYVVDLFAGGESWRRPRPVHSCTTSPSST